MGKHRGRGSSANALKKSFSTKKPDDKTTRSKTWEKKPHHSTMSNKDPKNLLQNKDKQEDDLNLFLGKVHKNPTHFKEEMIEKIKEFNETYENFKENSSARDEKFVK